jgi:hypothetical protein
VELVRKKANIAATDKIVLVPYPGKRSLFEVLFSRADESAALETKIEKVLGKLPLGVMSQGGFLKVMPYSITVR